MTDQIKRIYEEMADKTLSFWNKVIVNCYQKRYEEWKWSHLFLKWSSNAIYTNSTNRVLINWFNNVEVEDDFDYNSQSYSMMEYWDFIYQTKEIIGHPVMYWNVVYWIEKKMEWEWTLFEPNSQYPQVLQELFEKWKDKTKPIEDQPQETIDFVESLIPKK